MKSLRHHGIAVLRSSSRRVGLLSSGSNSWSHGHRKKLDDNSPVFSNFVHTVAGRCSLEEQDQREQQLDHKQRLYTTSKYQPLQYTTHRAGLPSHTLHLSPSYPQDPLLATRRDHQVAYYHSSATVERTAVAVILGLGALSAASYAGSSAVKAWNEYKASLPEESAQDATVDDAAKATDKSHKDTKTEQAKETKKKDDSAGPRENIFVKWLNMEVNYYEGGFEETMTKQEAALILGVRQSSSPQRIKEAHRKLLILNHPDTGGSTYISGKINEAKELLLKGKRK